VIDLERDKQVSRYDLDKQLEEQTALHIEYGKNYAEKYKKMLQAKRNIAIVEAEIDSAIRENPESFGIASKVTETAIKSALVIDEEVRKAHEDFHTAVEEEKIAQEVLSAIAFDRKQALTDMKDLWLGSYYSGVSNPSRMAEKINEEQTASELRKNRRKRE